MFAKRNKPHQYGILAIFMILALGSFVQSWFFLQTLDIGVCHREKLQMWWQFHLTAHSSGAGSERGRSLKGTIFLSGGLYNANKNNCHVVCHHFFHVYRADAGIYGIAPNDLQASKQGRINGWIWCNTSMKDLISFRIHIEKSAATCYIFLNSRL